MEAIPLMNGCINGEMSSKHYNRAILCHKSKTMNKADKKENDAQNGHTVSSIHTTQFKQTSV